MPALIRGPMLRYVGESEATVWVEVDSACEVEVLGRTAPTFEVEGHHYALVYMTDLAPATRHPYTVRIDGECVWPESDSPFPPCVIQTFDKEATLRIAFGSCRVSMPHEPPYTLTHADDDKLGFEIDALRALALRWWAKQGERLRRWLDLEHWSAFGASFKRIVDLIRRISIGEHCQAPGTLTILSGDVHHVYLAEAMFEQAPAHCPVHHAVCSPLGNPLGARDRRIMRAGWSRWASALMRGIARLAGVDNQIATLSFNGPEASICFEKSVPGDAMRPRLESVFEYRLDKTDA